MRAGGLGACFGPSAFFHGTGLPPWLRPRSQGGLHQKAGLQALML